MTEVMYLLVFQLDLVDQFVQLYHVDPKKDNISDLNTSVRHLIPQ